MTREEFIEILDKKSYSYKIEGDKLVVTYNGNIFLNSSKTISPGVEFKNKGNVYLDSLETIPPGVEFKNKGNIFLNSLKNISHGVEFKNDGNIFLNSSKTISPGVEFKTVPGKFFLNGGSVYLPLIGGWFDEWSGNIEEIDRHRLLNLMIKRGLFI